MKKSKDEKLLNEAIEFSKVIKSELDSHIFKQHSDQNKIRCVEFIQRGLSLSEVSGIFGVPKSTLCGWKFRIESLNCDSPLKANLQKNLRTNNFQKFNNSLDVNKLVEVHLTNSLQTAPILEPNIEFKISSNNLKLSIKNLNLESTKELMKAYLKCLSMRET